MQALMHPRLAKIASTGAKANGAQAHSSQEPADEKSIGKRFLAILLSCLSAWGT